MIKIKVKHIRGKVDLPTIIDKGDWIDLRCAKKTTIIGPMKQKDSNAVTFNNTLLPLGIAIKLPPGYEAILAPRGSTYKYYGVIQSNSFGVIDNSFNGDNDEWMLPVIAFKKTTIPEGDRVCQFRIQLSQKANIIQKIKWLFSNKIIIEEVDNFGESDRKGFGSTGVK